MRITRTIFASTVFAVTLAAQPVSAAQSIAITNGVTVIRGVDDAEDQKHGWTTRERGVTVFRGNPTPYEAAEAKEKDDSGVQVITSGNNLWLVNPNTGSITGCELKPNLYGQLSIDCATK